MSDLLQPLSSDLKSQLFKEKCKQTYFYQFPFPAFFLCERQHDCLHCFGLFNQLRTSRCCTKYIGTMLACFKSIFNFRLIPTICSARTSHPDVDLRTTRRAQLPLSRMVTRQVGGGTLLRVRTCPLSR